MSYAAIGVLISIGLILLGKQRERDGQFVQPYYFLLMYAFLDTYVLLGVAAWAGG